MHVIRFDEAPEYSAPGHYDMRCLRIQGKEAGPTSAMWLAVSTIEPGGGIVPGTSSLEKIYVVLEGSVTIHGEDHIAVLGRWDSCRIAPSETRALKNHGDRPAVVLLIMELER